VAPANLRYINVLNNSNNNNVILHTDSQSLSGISLESTQHSAYLRHATEIDSVVTGELQVHYAPEPKKRAWRTDVLGK